MKYEGVCIAVKNVNLSKKFYQDLFDLEIFQDYGINVSFGGLSLQQYRHLRISFKSNLRFKGNGWKCSLLMQRLPSGASVS